MEPQTDQDTKNQDIEIHIAGDAAWDLAIPDQARAL
jgi:hypothetical protein